MALQVISLIVIAVSISRVFAEPPVRLDERHLRPVEIDELEKQRQADNGWQDSVPGLPGKDYPNLTSIPETSFSCSGKTPGGYYADVETRCQVFHVCSTQGAKSSFLCPSGSIFNQRHFVCDWWYDFECEHALELYSLNRALDEPEVQQQDVPSFDAAPLQFNTIGGGPSGSGGDLSLASSGYPNNIRDEANQIYEDYASVKIHDAGGGSSNGASPSKEKSPSSGGIEFAGGSTSEIASGFPGADNHSEGRRGSIQESATFSDRVDPPGRLNGPYRPRHSAHEYRQRGDSDDGRGARDYLTEDRSTTASTTTTTTTTTAAAVTAAAAYRRRPTSHGSADNVPRGFSKNSGEEQTYSRDREFKIRNDQGPGFLVNNGLSAEYEINQNKPLPRENNNYIDSSNSFNKANINQNHNNNNNINNNNNNKQENQYLNPEKYPLPQENNNYENNYHNNDNKNNVDNNSPSNNYYNQNNVNSNDQPNGDDSIYKYIKFYQKSSPSHSSSSDNTFDFPEDRDYDASTTSPRAIYSNPTEDDIDRERQREVDSADLKRQRPQHRDFSSSSTSTFLIREESSTSWRDDLSTSSSGSSSPPFPPDRSYLSPGPVDTPSLPRPEIPTTPVATDDGLSVSNGKKEQPKYLGRRPAGGLPGGAGNGLPGANKILVGSDSITGKPADDDDRLSPVSPSPSPSPGGNGGGGNTAGGSWDDQENSYLPPRGYNGEGNGNGEFRGDGQYWDRNSNGGQAWNNAGRFDGRY